jgi:hypothetical protein
LSQVLDYDGDDDAAAGDDDDAGGVDDDDHDEDESGDDDGGGYDVYRDDDDDDSYLYDCDDIDDCFLLCRGTHGNPLGFLQHTKATIMQSEDATFLQQLGMM